MRAVLLIGALVWLAGCSSSEPMAVEEEPVPREQYPQVVVTNTELRPYVAAGEPIVSGTPDGPMKVVVPIRATSDVALHVNYQFEFFDEQGFPIKPVQDWRYLMLPPRAQRFMEGASLDRGVAEWRVIIRPAP